jgi:hypothetical protein
MNIANESFENSNTWELQQQNKSTFAERERESK